MNLHNFKNLRVRTKTIVIILILAAICSIEFIFDIAEITVGEILEISNPFRPKSGTIWDLNKQDQIADRHLLEISKNINDNKIERPQVNTIFKLKSLLNEQGTLIISVDQFLKLYNLLPPRSAQEIISPFELLKILHSQKWTWTKIIKGENTLRFFFLDADNQLLLDSYPDFSVIYNITTMKESQETALESMSIFSGRSISFEQFFNSFNSLPNPIKLQLINNPYQLIKWYNNIRLVAISRFVKNHTVLIGFEVFNGIDNEVYTFQASEIATNYLITQLNLLYPNLKFEMPE